ncbi:MAG: diguanylate cyclase [bacterium]|nr:diguanylate cyclase [bacterium]
MPVQYKIFQDTEPQVQTKWLPILVGTLLCILVLLLWWTLNEQDNRALLKRVEAEAHKLASNMEADMRSRIPSLQRIVSRWEMHGGTTKEEFISDARAYVNDLPGLQALEWVDTNALVRWLVPFVGNEKADGLDLTAEIKRRRALEKAKITKRPAMTDPITLVQGDMGFRIFFPIFVRGEFDGYIAAVFKVRDWLDFVFRVKHGPGEQEHFMVWVSIDGVEVFARTSLHEPAKGGPTAFESTEVLGHRIVVRCRPADSLIEASRSFLNIVIGLIGLLLSVLVSFVVHLFQKAATEVWRTHSAKSALEEVIRKHRQMREELQHTSSRLTLATKAGKIGVWVWEVETNKLIWDAIMYELYDVPPDVNPTYETWKNAVYPADFAHAENLLQQALEGKAVFNTEFRVLLPGETIRYIQAAARVERDEIGNAVRMTGVNWNITERKLAAELLATERRRLSDILEGTNVGTWEWNVQTGEAIFNERWANIIGYTLKELAPVTIDTRSKFCHPDDFKVSGELLEKHFSKELDYYEFESRMRHKNGDWVWVLDRGKVATWTKEGKPLVMSGTHMEITERKKAEEKIRHLATHDALTDLTGLRMAKERAFLSVKMAKRNKKPAAVMFIDLDGFKSVNDGFGHEAGDAILKEVAKRLLSCVRETDTVARIGGDEFLVVLTEIQTKDDAARIADKLVKKVALPLQYNDKELHVGASVGIAIYPENGDKVDLLIKQADKAMYEIKNSGKNGYAFAPPE